MCGPKAPKPPDYAAAAEQTAQGDLEAARQATYANRIDQNNPWGSVNYESYQDVDPATGQAVTRWRENTTLTPQMQAALDAQMGLQQGRSELAGSMMGDLSQDYGTRMDFDQYGDPIQMGETGRMTGGGEGISSGGGMTGGNFMNMPAYQRQQLQQGMDFTDNTQQSLDYSGAPEVGSPEWTRAQAEKSVYDRGASRLDPQIEQESQALDVRLRSQGLQPGDEAYEAQMDNFNRRKTDAYDALNAQAMQEGSRQAQSMFGMESAYRDQATGEQDRLGDFWNRATGQRFDISKGMGDFANQAALGQMGADLQARLGEGGLRAQQAGLKNQAAMGNWDMQNKAQQQQFSQMMAQLGYNTDQDYRSNALANQLRSQGMNEDMQQRAYRLNEVNSLLSGQQVQAPQFGGYAQQGQTRGPDYLGAAGTQYESQMGQFGANQALLNSLIGGGAQLGAGLASGGFFSDRRLKKNIKPIGKIDGNNWYEFDYVWGEHSFGVMADEVPHAAFEHPSGFLMVDYSKI